MVKKLTKHGREHHPTRRTTRFTVRGSPAPRPARVPVRAGLESAVSISVATFGGVFLHQTIPSMAAAYLFHICQNHPFLDGNKRTAANAAITFLPINDWELDFSEDELALFCQGMGEPGADLWKAAALPEGFRKG